MRRPLFSFLVLLSRGRDPGGPVPGNGCSSTARTTTGWRGFKTSAFPDRGWVVADGWIKHLKTAKARRRRRHHHRRHVRQLRSQLRVEVAPGANSGVKYLVTEDRSGPIAHGTK